MGKKTKLIILLSMDIALIAISWIATFAIIGTSISKGMSTYWYLLLINLGIILILAIISGLYSNIWQYAGFIEAVKIFIVAFVAGVANVLIAVFVKELTYSWAFLVSFFQLIALIIPRSIFKFCGYFGNISKQRSLTESNKRVIVIGGGEAGAALVKEMKFSSKLKMTPVCVLDDNTKKLGQVINGVKIVGTTAEVEDYAKKYKADEIIVAIPSLSGLDKKRILEGCQKTGCKVLAIPGIYQFADGDLSVSNAQDVTVSDLLGREQVKVDLDEIMGYIENKVVMVTGGGGSIGSELCRQIARHNPKQLIILDIYENNAYDIEQELKRHYPENNILVLIASVRDKKKIDDIFSKYKPQIVFHAAAHKHVPLMETSPNEAVKNNVGGTFNVADAAGRFNVERFILISTDKAVNPTNIMGATKRICEMIIQTMDKKYNTEYVAVRFGNVLGSNGSVIPLFKKQIRDGGPVTVTHKDIVRYFMTIPEAVSLVLQAGAYAKGGEIFVLDMGEPVRIYDLAINLIKLSNLEPFKDIDIVITGLRPGEKLYEERLMEEEGLLETPNKMISIGKPISFDEKHLFGNIKALVDSANNETDNMKELVSELVPTYKIDNRPIK